MIRSTHGSGRFWCIVFFSDSPLPSRATKHWAQSELQLPCFLDLYKNLFYANMLAMDITQLTSQDLRRLSALLEAKEKFQAKLNEINAQLVAFGEGTSSGPAKGPARAKRRAAGAKAPKRRRGGAPRGALQEGIVGALQAAGGKGVHIKELSAKLGVKVPNLRVWFLTTGKKNKSIKKVAKATFAWKG